MTFSPGAFLFILQFKNGCVTSRRIEEKARSVVYVVVVRAHAISMCFRHGVSRHVSPGNFDPLRSRVKTRKLHSSSRHVTSHLDKRLSR